MSTAALLFASVLLAFAPVVRNEFVNYDDDDLVSQPRLRQGFTAESLRWALTTTEFPNWHPLTLVSHMLDFRLFGMQAGGHHATSALIHATNTALLFGVLRALTGSLWRSALVAALLGLHPLRVESVAWISERKDVLTLLFGLLALGCYLRFVRRRAAGAFAAALALYACALMSKAMLVTFPLLLLLLDLWPLGRWSRGAKGLPLPDRRLLGEKIPFLALALAVGLLTYATQDAGGAVGVISQYGIAQRLGNAFASCGAYLAKTVWPVNLAVFYPYDWREMPWWQPTLGAAVVATTTGVSLASFRRLPAVFVGWVWYLVSLLPVIGIIQAGSQALADRYTYVPHVGLFLLVAWGLGGVVETRPRARPRLLAAAPVVLAALAAATWSYAAVWRTSESLFTHALSVTRNNYIALWGLGIALMEQGRVAEGGELVRRSFEVAPHTRASVLEGSGDHYARSGRAREAARYYRQALEIAPFNKRIRNKLLATGVPAEPPGTEPAPDPHRMPAGTGDAQRRGDLLARAGRYEEAAAAYREAIRREPGNYDAWHNLGCALGELGRREEARDALRETLRLKPDHALARRNLEGLENARLPGR